MKRPKLLYFYDALCGWCYGFSPVMQKTAATYSDQFDFQVISGGMIIGERIGPIGTVAPYIRTAYKDVENAAGVSFGKAFLEDILEEGSAIFTSIPAAIAMAVFQTHLPEKTVAFAGALQKAIYFDGIKPADFSAYVPYAANFGIDPDLFLAQMQEERFQELAQADFNLAAEFGIGGFPTVVLEKGEKYFLLARGFMHWERFEQSLKKALEL
jgi:putative protein-disulfide isomerase